MRYYIETILDRVGGWLMPDNPAVKPAVTVVRDRGRLRVLMPATIERPDVQARVSVGSVAGGFTVHPSFHPDVTESGEMEIYDAESNMLLFRRGEFDPVEMRFFHLETQTLPVLPMGKLVAPLFHMIYESTEYIGEETLGTCLAILHRSIFATGALLYRAYDGILEPKDYRRSVILSSANRELAGRILRAKRLAGEGAGREGWRSLGQGALIEAFGPVDPTDPVALGRAFKKLSDEEFFALANPTVRKLVLKSPADRVGLHHVGQALDTLAEFDIVGFDDRLDLFLDDFELLVGRKLPSRTLPEPSPVLDAVTEAVAACRPARELVLLDEHLNHLARTALDRAQAVPATPSA